MVMVWRANLIGIAAESPTQDWRADTKPNWVNRYTPYIILTGILYIHIL